MLRLIPRAEPTARAVGAFVAQLTVDHGLQNLCCAMRANALRQLPVSDGLMLAAHISSQSGCFDERRRDLRHDCIAVAPQESHSAG